jgi:predicted alpha-1,2-mannosidase
VLFLTVVGTLSAQHLADLPDPLVGTDSSYELSHGNTYPAVFLPFAMSNWTAETGDGGWPYQYSKDKIRGFRSTHRPSAWMFDWGPFSVMPMTGELHLLPDRRASKFRHEDEDARAYRYRVLLEDYGIQADMAPTRHGGILRFTFPKAEQAWIVIDDSPGGATLHIDPEMRTISGTNSSAPRSTASNFTLYFVAVFDRAFIVHGASDKAAWVGFATKQGEGITVRVGTSLISAEQARRNLDREIPRPDFDRVVADARAEWDRELGRIEIAGGSEAERRTFYTALYHVFQMPRMLTETDASGAAVHYSPYDGKVHSGPMFSDTGFWDTFRAEFPLLALLQPARDAEIIRAMLNAFDEGGWIPKWPNPAETNVMIGTHADSVIADAYAKGIRDYDVDKAYRALYKDATQTGSGNFEGRGGLEDYVRLGYVPADHGVPESVSRTLEYAYDDFCVATMAQALGKADDYRMFAARSRNYRNVFDPSTGFMRGRTASGEWVQPFDPLDWGGVFTEGNAWQWLWSVQHDVPGLIELLGGREAFLRKLDAMFSMTSDFKVGGYGKVIHEMTEAKLQNMGQYAHVNEPVHHVVYLYDYVGQPWKTQKLVHEVMTRLYKPGPDGWLGDEDTGQMSAWYIFSALGFYPVVPGRPVYALGTPLFDRATIHLESGRTFTVEAARQGPNDIYVQSATLNDRALEGPWIEHLEIASGGVLRFVLGPRPNQKWGASGQLAQIVEVGVSSGENDAHAANIRR